MRVEEAAGGGHPVALIAGLATQQMLVFGVGGEQPQRRLQCDDRVHRSITALAAAYSAASPSGDRCT